MEEDVLNFLFSVNSVAWIGAVTGTISLGWKIYTHGQERAGNIKIDVEVKDSVRNTIHLTFTNVAYEDRRITYVGYCLEPRGFSFGRIRSMIGKSPYVEVKPTHVNGQYQYRFESQPRIKMKFVLSRGEQAKAAFIVPLAGEDKRLRVIKVMGVDSLGKKYYSKWINV